MGGPRVYAHISTLIKYKVYTSVACLIFSELFIFYSMLYYIILLMLLHSKLIIIIMIPFCVINYHYDTFTYEFHYSCILVNIIIF